VDRCGGTVDLAGPDDPLPGLAAADLPRLLRTIYAAAVGGTPDDWVELDASMASERHTAALLRPTRTYSNPPEQSTD
jgi:hypothetical protein